MGIIRDLLDVREGAVSSINSGTGALALVGTAPLSFSRNGQTITGAITYTGRGALLHGGVTGWGSLSPPSTLTAVLTGNGSGGALSWCELTAGSGISVTRTGNTWVIAASQNLQSLQSFTAVRSEAEAPAEPMAMMAPGTGIGYEGTTGRALWLDTAGQVLNAGSPTTPAMAMAARDEIGLTVGGVKRFAVKPKVIEMHPKQGMSGGDAANVDVTLVGHAAAEPTGTPAGCSAVYSWPALGLVSRASDASKRYQGFFGSAANSGLYVAVALLGVINTQLRKVALTLGPDTYNVLCL